MLNIKIAFDRMIKNEKKLLNFDNKRPNEEVVNHQLARRIAQTNINTDVEYGIDQTTGLKKGMHELGKALRPDIIIHKRGNNNDNKMVVECKWEATPNQIIKDICKILYFMTSKTYKYKEGYFVNYGEKNLKDSKYAEIKVSKFADIAKEINRVGFNRKDNYILKITFEDVVNVPLLFKPIFGILVGAKNIEIIMSETRNWEYLITGSINNNNFRNYLYTTSDGILFSRTSLQTQLDID